MGATIFGSHGKPTHCPAGHRLKAGKLILGWMPCAECDGGRGNFNGHHYIKCLLPGCGRILYVPPHEPDSSG